MPAELSRFVRKEYKSKIWLEVFSHYGRQCAACGRKHHLTIDHINGGGRAHRKSLGMSGSGHKFYVWIVKNKFPDYLQTLCFKCNTAKGSKTQDEWRHKETT